MLRSLIHFEFIFVYGVRKWLKHLVFVSADVEIIQEGNTQQLH